jgi:indolepyruvate decarboxylase
VRISVGDYLLKRLGEIGVHYLFGVPGDYNLWFLEQAERSNHIEFVGCCNELNAAYAADGSARICGISALVTTYGVGELSAIGAVAGAYAEGVPIVCIIGAPPLGAMEGHALLHHTLGDGNFINMLNCHREFSVAQARIEPANARYEIDRVLRCCWLKKRPVYLQLPCDVAATIIEAGDESLDLCPPISDPMQLSIAIERIANRLADANAPTFLLDGDIGRFGLTQSLIKFIQTHSIPFATLPPARALIDETHDLYLGTYRGGGSPPEIRDAVEMADCLVCVGVRFTDTSTGFFSHRLQMDQLVYIRAFDVMIGSMYLSAVVGLELLNGLIGAVPPRPGRLLPPRAKPPVRRVKSGQVLTQESFWQRMQHFIQTNDIVLTDVGTCLAGVAGLQMPKGVTVIGQPLWAATGYGLPALLGTLLEAPGRRQILFIGDGAFQVTAQEISTILGRGLRAVIFLINNCGYTIERLILGGAGAGYNNVNQWRYAEAISFFDTSDRASSYRVGTEGELEAALAEASRSESLVLIEVVMNRMDAPKALVHFARKCAKFNYLEGPAASGVAAIDVAGW